MVARARPHSIGPRQGNLSPADEADVRAGIEQASRGEFADMSPEEKQLYLETGALPERVARWLESYSSRNAT
jgi:hypothetical protein